MISSIFDKGRRGSEQGYQQCLHAAMAVARGLVGVRAEKGAEKGVTPLHG